MNSTPISESVINLWVMQFLFGVTPWLILAIGIAVVAVIFNKFDRIAEKRQKEPIEAGIRGVPRIIKNQTIMTVMIFVMRNLAAIAIFFSASATYIIAYLLRNRVEMETAKLPDEYMESGVEWSIGFIVICGIIGITITITIAIESYYALRHRGKLLLQQASGKPGTTPLIARLYGSKTIAGIIIIVVGCYPLWAIIMNLILGFVLITPLPTSLLTIELPATNILLLAMFSVLWVGVIYSLASPTVVISWRHLIMTYRQYSENRSVHIVSISLAAIMLGLFGGLINMWLLRSIGEALFPYIF
jgi:hypothetical protein